MLNRFGRVLLAVGLVAAGTVALPATTAGADVPTDPNPTIAKPAGSTSP